MKPYLLIGRVVKPQGIRGEVKVLPITDDPARFLRLKTAYIQTADGFVPRRVLSARVGSDAVYLSLEGIPDRNAAEGARGLELFVDRDNAVKLPVGRYFIEDLVGCSVATDQGRAIGTLSEVFSAGGADVWRVQGAKTVLFPALKALIVSVDITSRRIVIRDDKLSEVVVDED